MAVMSTLSIASASLALFANSVSAASPLYLSPDQEIVLPSSSLATNPLEWLGANGPYYEGPDVYGVGNEVPEGCVVEQVAYVSRHGSRYPDSGAYAQWAALYGKIQAADFTAKGELAFLENWKPVLTNPTFQIAAESPTGWTEAYGLGYKLRTKYPDLYAAGTPFISWANLYPRVVATAQNFVRGFLGEKASTLGQVITVNSTASPLALFDSLAPSDLCPAYVDGNGGTQATTWDSIYLPPITARLNALLSGNLNFTTTDVGIFPYLCGFESQITGILSPWCSTFSDAELKKYEYRQDLRYYYGSGPGTDLPSKMMLPFLNGLINLLAKGPGINGTAKDGSVFALPNILTAFSNDGQLTQLVAASGVFDDQTPLLGTAIPTDWKYISSRFVSMRGTIAFERLSCAVSSKPASAFKTSTTKHSLATSCSTAATTSAKACNRDNCFRQMLQSSAVVSEFCGTYTTAVSTATKGLPTYVSQCQNLPSRISSACSCIAPATVAPSVCSTSSATTSTSATATPTPSSGNSTYIRILLNDAVYTVPGCADGPGKSCLMSSYKTFVGDRLAKAGDLKSRCNVTLAGTPDTLKGASFLTNLDDSWLASVVP